MIKGSASRTEVQDRVSATAMETLTCIFCHGVIAATNGSSRYRDHLCEFSI